MSALALSAAACSANNRAALIPETLASGPTPTATSPRPACQSSPRRPEDLRYIVEWVDFVNLRDVEYLSGQSMDYPVPAPDAADIGAVVGTVRCELGTLSYGHLPGPSADGDSAYLPVGTQVHAIRGFAPACRVTALIDGQYRVYLAHHTVDRHSQPVPCASAPTTAG